MKQELIQYKPQIFKQGLVLVVIPFLVGSCVLLLLSQVWLSADKLVLTEERQNELLAHFNFAFSLWGEVGGNLLARTLDERKGRRKGESYVEISQKLTDRLRLEFSTVRDLSTRVKGSAENVENLEAICLDSIKDISTLPAAVSSSPINHFRTMQQLPLVFHRLFVMPSKFRAALESEWKWLQSVRQLETEQSKKTRLAAYICIFGNIVLSFSLVWIIARGITKRLEIVTTNASLIPNLKKLSLHVQGNDELAFLDASLHTASAKLSAAAEHRRTILGMVAHDMRSPLLAAQLYLEVLDELMTDNYSEGTKTDLDLAVAKIKGILEQVHLLLTVEKDSAQDDQENILPRIETVTPDSSPKSLQAESLYQQSGKGKLQDLNEPLSGPLSEPLSGPLSEPLSGRLSIFLRVKRFLGDMFFSPKIFHKGLWLVIIPLLVQSFFLFLVNQQSFTTEKIVAEERAQCNLLMNVNRVFLSSMKATMGESLYNISCEPAMKEAVLHSYKHVADGFTSIMLIAEQSPEWLTIMKDWQSVMLDHLKELRIQEDLEQGTSAKQIIARFKRHRQDRSKIAEISERAILLFQKESTRLKNLQKEQRRARKRVTDILVWGIFANFVLAIGMLARFSNDIKSRVNILVAGAARLGDPKPIHEPLAGTDELAYLDLIFQHTHGQLFEAASGRAAMMNTLALEMASPLREAQQALRAFKKNEEGKLDDRKLRQLTRAESNINRVLDLLNDLLIMETLETGKITLECSACNIGQFVDESIATVSSLAAAKKISIINQCQDFSLTADKSRLIQTVINFLSNAIKFSPEMKRITVTCGRQAEYLRISVIDEGPGMDESTKNHVFDKFFQAEGQKKHQGFGLGLAICRMIVESHGGHIGVDSELGQGCNFWFELPISLLILPAD